MSDPASNPSNPAPDSLDEEPIRAQSLHALLYCERLFFLEEVEKIRVADAAVYAGRRLHAEIERDQDEDEIENLYLESAELGLVGRLDAIKTREGKLVPYEHKRGRACTNLDGTPGAWSSDQVQVFAYALLIETERKLVVSECRIRYHEDRVTVRLPFDDAARKMVYEAIHLARMLRQTVKRPPVTSNERLCTRCSLAPVCLPEEARLKVSADASTEQERQPIRLFPSDDERQVIHVLESGASVGRSGDQFKVWYRDGRQEFVPGRKVSAIVLHGFAQISSQALRMCAEMDVGVHYITGGGRYIGAFNSIGPSAVQRRIRQYAALSDNCTCLNLAKQLVLCRGDMQRQVLLRASRRSEENQIMHETANGIKAVLKRVDAAPTLEYLRGLEGSIGARYFKAFGSLISPDLPQELQFKTRNRRPPRDRVNALLGFGYAQLLRDVTNAILIVGLEPALGFYHQPRSQAPPLALDLMEIFRVLLVDIPVLNSLNRQQWDIEADFAIAGSQVWLSDVGKRKFIQLYERRKAETWKHPVIGYSLSYNRLMELETRLLEKSWANEADLFAKIRLR